MCSMQNALLIWHADKATCCMQSFANPHKHCCGEQLAARVAPTLAYNHVCWHLWTNCGVESCCAPCLLAPSRLRMCTRRHVLRAAVRRIRLCLQDIRMCTHRHVLRAAVRRIRLCHQCTCVSVDMYYSAILCAVFTCAPKTYVFVSTGM